MLTRASGGATLQARSVETGWRFDATGLRGGPCARIQRRSEPFHSAVALTERHRCAPGTARCLRQDRHSPWRGRHAVSQGSRRARGSDAHDAAPLGAGGRDPGGGRHGRVEQCRGGARAHRRPPSRARPQARAHQAGREAGTARVRLHRGDVRRRAAGALAARSLEAHRPRARADRALLDEPWAAGQRPRAAPRRGHRGAALRVGGAGGGLPARRLPPALPRVRAGPVADRRRRGAAVPPLRSRAADPRGRARPPDGRGDAGPRRGSAAARIADHGLRPPALPPALRRAGRGRPHGGRDRGRGRRPGADARRDRVRRPRGLHPPHRGGGRGRGAVLGGALRGGGDEYAAPACAGREDDRRRGDGRGARHRGARGLGGGLHLAVRRAPRAADRRTCRHDALPRRRLLRARREPDLAGGGPRAGRRGARDGLRGGRGARLLAFDLRGHRPGEAQGVRRAARALPGDRTRGMSELALDAARASGLVRAGEPLLVMVSGGGDSVALLDIAHRLEANLTALHVNYSLRENAQLDEALVQKLCDERGVPLTVEHAPLDAAAGGNLQERARDLRYSLAEELAEGDYAAAHTASDRAEIILYRLAVSPGSRALHGMAPRRGRLVRPLLGVTREEVRDYLRARRLEWREDPSNADRRFARARVRHDVIDALRELSPAAERTIAETARQLRDEAEVLDAVVDEALSELGGGPAISLPALLEHPPAVRRLVLRALAERAAGAAAEPRRDARGERSRAPSPLSRREVEEILALGERGSKSLDLGGGLRAVSEYGTLRFTRAADAAPPDPVPLSVPGRTRFGDWEVEARLGGPGDVTVSHLV